MGIRGFDLLPLTSTNSLTNPPTCRFTQYGKRSSIGIFRCMKLIEVICSGPKLSLYTIIMYVQQILVQMQKCSQFSYLKLRQWPKFQQKAKFSSTYCERCSNLSLKKCKIFIEIKAYGTKNSGFFKGNQFVI